jgi:hypothetical protein
MAGTQQMLLREIFQRTTADFLLGDLFRIEWSRIHMMLSLELEYTG